MKNKTKVKKSRNGLKGAANAVLLWYSVLYGQQYGSMCSERKVINKRHKSFFV